MLAAAIGGVDQVPVRAPSLQTVCQEVARTEMLLVKVLRLSSEVVRAFVMLQLLIISVWLTVLAQPQAAAAAKPRLMVQAGPQSLMQMSLVISPDKSLIASAGDSDGTVYLWEATTGRVVCTLAAGLSGERPLLGLRAPPMAFSEDGRMLATAREESSATRTDQGATAPDPAQLVIWDLQGCREARRHILPNEFGRNGIAQMLSLPGGQVLLAASDVGVYVADAFGPSLRVRRLAPNLNNVTGLQGVSADGSKVLMSVNSEIVVVSVAAGNQVRLGAVESGQSRSGDSTTLMANLTPIQGALSPSGRWAVSFQAGELKLFDAAQGRLMKQVTLVQRPAGSSPGMVSGLPPGMPAGMPSGLLPGRSPEQPHGARRGRTAPASDSTDTDGMPPALASITEALQRKAEAIATSAPVVQAQAAFAAANAQYTAELGRTLSLLQTRFSAEDLGNDERDCGISQALVARLLALPEGSAALGRCVAAKRAMDQAQVAAVAAVKAAEEGFSRQASQAVTQWQGKIAAQAKGMSPETGIASFSTWVGFAAGDRSLLVMRPEFVGSPLTAGPGEARMVMEVRSLPGLDLVRKVAMSDSSSTGSGLPIIFAPTAALSRDAGLLALGMGLQGADFQGGKLGLVDLNRMDGVVRTWRPRASELASVAFTGDGYLVAMSSPSAVGVPPVLQPLETSVQERPAANASRSLGARSEREFNQSYRTNAIAWSLSTGDTASALTSVGSAIAPSGVAPNGQHAATLRLELKNGAPSGAASPSTVHLDLLGAPEMIRVATTALGELPPDRALNWLVAVASDGSRVAVLRREREASPMPGSVPDGASRTGTSGEPKPSLSLYQRHRRGIRRLWESRLDVANPYALHFSRDGTSLLLASAEGQSVLSLADNRVPGRPQLFGGPEVRLLDTGRLLVVAGDRSELPRNLGVPVLRWRGNVPENIASDTAGQWVASSGPEGLVEVRPIVTGNAPEVGEAIRLEGHSARVKALAFTPDGRHLLSTAVDGTSILWNFRQGNWLLKLFAFDNGGWAVVDPEGRFDTNRLENLDHIHWVMPGDPWRPVPLEVFMRDYFEPRLMSRILAGAALRPVADLSSLNIARPISRVLRVAPAGNGTVDVTVEVSEQTDSRGRRGGAVDVRLFRDGKLVGSSEQLGTTLRLDSNGVAQAVFKGIRLPSQPVDVEFSAYAFNADRVKGPTAKLRVPVARDPASAVKGRAYVIAVGVNEHENAAFNLGYAVNDAKGLMAGMSDALKATAQFREVVGITLISQTGGAQDATKAKIRAAMDRLAGRSAGTVDLTTVANASKLEKATPDDAVFITFAGHGHNDVSGQFYLFPSDIGPGQSRAVSPSLLARSISTDELAQWLQHIDAGELALVLDACQSAASIDSAGFKPGPMGSRGLGQLAYDKGMRVLAATQSDELAKEFPQLQHGLLTYALLQEGLLAARADYRPQDGRIEVGEWLSYAVRGAPDLERELRTGVKPQEIIASRGASRLLPAGARAVPLGQRPRLFDFSNRAPAADLVLRRVAR